MDLVPVVSPTLSSRANTSGDGLTAKRKLDTARSFFLLSALSSPLGSVACMASNSCKPFQTTSDALLPLDSNQKAQRRSVTEPPPLTRCDSDGKISKAFGEMLTADEETNGQCIPNVSAPDVCQLSLVHEVSPQNISPQADSQERRNPFLDDGTWSLRSVKGSTSTFVTTTDSNNSTFPQRSSDSGVMLTLPTPNKRVCCQQGFTQNKATVSRCDWTPSPTQARKRSPVMSDGVHFASATPLDKQVVLSINMNLESESNAIAGKLSSCLSSSSTPSIAVLPRARASAPKRTYPSQQRRSRNPGNLSLDLSQMDHVHFDPCTTATEASKCRNDQAALCSKITDFLYIGGAIAAKNKSLLITNGITHVINCAASVAPASFPDDFCYFNMRLRDHSSQDIARHFYSIFDFIERARECDGRIFLHCVKGISRSPTMAIAYLMWHKNISMYEALNFVRQARPIVDPNAGFIFQLTEWEQQHPNGRLQFQRTIVFQLEVVYAHPDKIGNCSSSLLTKNPLFVPLPDIGESYFHDPTRDIGEQCLIVACADYMFVWCGTDVNEDQMEVAESGARILQRYEAFPVKCDTLRQGKEPMAFWDLVGDNIM